MSESLTIRSYRHEYTVDFISDYPSALRNQLREGDYVIVDRNVLALHPPLQASIDGFERLDLEPDETAKSYAGIAPVIETLIEKRFTKSNRLIAIGGGIVQDVAAFTASILHRGVDWLFFPTNLLAQCDSCIGSKTSINFGAYKNQLGGFFPPKAIFIDRTFLSTLPPREIRSGLGEMMHYFLVNGENDFTWAASRLAEAMKPGKTLQALIHRSLAIKKEMIERDEFDQGPRNVFNYGHSFGHALESTTDYSVPHGIAVGFGMDLANLISHHQGLLPLSSRNRIRNALARIWTETTLPAIDPDRFFFTLARDKKNEGMAIKVILTRGIGQMFKTTLELNPGIRALISRYFAERLYLLDL